VVQLVDEELALLLAPLAVGDVEARRHRPDDAPGVVVQGQRADHERAHAPAGEAERELLVLHGLAAQGPLEGHPLRGEPVPVLHHPDVGERRVLGSQRPRLLLGHPHEGGGGAVAHHHPAPPDRR
jgi:hypothetical protein